MKKKLYTGLLGATLMLAACSQPDRFGKNPGDDENPAGDMQDGEAEADPGNQSRGYGTSNGYDDDTTGSGEIEHEHE